MYLWDLQIYNIKSFFKQNYGWKKIKKICLIN